MKKFLILIFAAALFAQQNEINLSGVLSIDSKLIPQSGNDKTVEINDNLSGKKSPFLAGVLSFAIPGAGEFYTESYIKSAIFFAAEVTAVSVGLAYDKKGDDQTEVFQNFAHSHWSVERYAQWTLDNFTDVEKFPTQHLNPEDFQNLFSEGRVNWSVLNEMEDKVGRIDNDGSNSGKYYSHRLAPFGDQQYYEMIGKYSQFNVGWDDFNSDEYNYLEDGVTPNFDHYSGLRGKANDFYNIASTAVKIIVVNHIISALDAVWSASRYNKTLTASVQMKKTNHGFVIDIHPELNLVYRF